MAEQTSDCVQRAYILQASSPNNKVLLERFQRELSGKVTNIRWSRCPDGVAESIDMTFPDDTSLRITRFLAGAGKGITLNIKRTK